jgi:hypothetical protein
MQQQQAKSVEELIVIKRTETSFTKLIDQTAMVDQIKE